MGAGIEDILAVKVEHMVNSSHTQSPKTRSSPRDLLLSPGVTV